MNMLRKLLPPRRPGRLALASLALLGVLATFAPPASAAQISPGASSGGVAGGGVSEPIGEEGLFGWTVGEVTITAPFSCLACKCQFLGPSKLTAPPSLQNCRIESEQTYPIPCPGSNGGPCKDMAMGEQRIVTFGCCVAQGGVVFCTTRIVILTVCP